MIPADAKNAQNSKQLTSRESRYDIDLFLVLIVALDLLKADVQHRLPVLDRTRLC